MRVFRYDNESLIFEPVNRLKLLTSLLALMLISCFVGILISKNTISFIHSELVLQENSEKAFSEEKLKKLVYSLNLKFPDIVLAQAYLETGNFKSKIFFENNNLFGMKVAMQRPTTAIETLNNHAVYDSWQDSVYDYALYQSRYLSSIKTEADYYAYLHNSYAEDKTYISKLKMLVNKL